MTQEQAKELQARVAGKKAQTTNVLPTPKNTGLRKGKELAHIKLALTAMDMAIVEEYRFHPVRRWRIDVAIPTLKIAIEYEGIFSKKSRHTTVTGYMGDIEKYNELTKLGWRLLRYHAKNYTEITNDLTELLNTKP